MSYKNIRPIEILHHEWCKKEGRDTSWFRKDGYRRLLTKEEQNVLLEPKKIKRTKRKRA